REHLAVAIEEIGARRQQPIRRPDARRHLWLGQTILHQPAADDAIEGSKAENDQADAVPGLSSFPFADALKASFGLDHPAAAAALREVSPAFQNHNAREERHQRFTDPVAMASTGMPPRGVGTGILGEGSAFLAAATPLIAAATSPLAPLPAIRSSIVVSGIGNCERGMGSSAGMASCVGWVGMSCSSHW